MKHTMKMSWFTLLVISLAMSSHANDEAEVTERARLNNVVNEIAYLQTYLQETEHARKHNVRTRFNYNKIVLELDLIKSGINEYVSQNLTQPKDTPLSSRAISGSYQQ